MDTETVTVTGNGTYATPNGYTLPTTATVTGTYQWTATYSGDANNNAAFDQGGPAEQAPVQPMVSLITDSLKAFPVGSGRTMPADNAAGNRRLPTAAHPGAATSAPATPGAGEQVPDEAVTVMYRAHYTALVRLAATVVGDVATAEDVVQDSFFAIHRSWWRLRDTGKALHYLRRSVINRSRSVQRRRAVADRQSLAVPPELPSAEDSALAAVQRSWVVAALSTLPVRQREVMALRYYADLTEEQIAAALGISRGAVKTHIGRAKDSLRVMLRLLRGILVSYDQHRTHSLCQLARACAVY